MPHAGSVTEKESTRSSIDVTLESPVSTLTSYLSVTGGVILHSHRSMVRSFTKSAHSEVLTISISCLPSYTGRVGSVFEVSMPLKSN